MVVSVSVRISAERVYRFVVVCKLAHHVPPDGGLKYVVSPAAVAAGIG